MADLFSDSDGEKAVEEILSQAMESTILEQVAAINCAGFTDSSLPSHLETRFQRLKSFPASTAKSFNLSHPPELKKIDSAKSLEEKNGENGEKGFSQSVKKTLESKNCLSSPSKSYDSGSFSPLKKTPRGKTEKKGTKSPSSSSSWDGFSCRSVSPPAKSSCFLCSPKKVSRRKNKVNKGLDLGKHDELLSDLSNSERKIIRKAMEKEERICKEAEKIVQWAKHASARMDISAIDDDLSDDENAKFH